MMPVYSPGRAFHSLNGDMRHQMHDENIPQHAFAGGGFSFQKRNGRIDWKKLAAVDIGRVLREVDVQTLQDNIVHVAFCDIESELNLRESDANLQKLFKLAQLLIEYLLHSQEHLQGYIGQIETSLHKYVQDQNILQTEVEKKNNMYRSLKREYQKSKKLIAEYQLMLRAGASGFHKCSFCSKSFLNDEFLKAHILRRHAEQSKDVQFSTPRLQRQFGNVTVTGQPNESANNEDLLRELGHITTKLQETESRFLAEREERDRKYEAERESEFKRWEEFSKKQLSTKDREIAELKVMVNDQRDMFSKEISTLTHEKNMMLKDIDAVKQNQGSKPSMLGTLQDVSGEERHEEELAKMKEQLQRELTASYQNELKKVRNREEMMKRAHIEEIGKIQSKLAKYEDAFQKVEIERQEQAGYKDEMARNKQMITEQAKKMLELEGMLKMQRSKTVDDEEMVEETRISQQAVLNSTPKLRRSSEAPKDSQDSDESLILYVAANSKNNFRVWKNPSPAQSEWKDTFNFKAMSVEKGQFNIPIYVYCASVSPYWRQYVSSSPTPPRPSYKLDFVFYVANVQLMGTIKVHVLQAGSGEVVKSMISKSEIYPNWKQKGLSFYVMRGPSTQSIAKSVSFQSTLNESELDSGDDVSVSSSTGTEDAKKNLAAAIARSREDLVERKKEEEVKAIRQEDTLGNQEEFEKEEDEFEEEEDEEDVTFDETDGKLTTMESTSQWGSTLLQTGAFLPFPNNPLAVARYNHTKEMIESCREDAIEILDNNLEKRGIDVEATGMTNEQFGSKMMLHDNEVNTKAKDRPDDEIAMRKKLHDSLDEVARDKLGIIAQEEEIKTPDKTKSKFRSAVNKIKNVTIFGRSSPRKKEDAKHKLKDSGSRPSSFIHESPSPKTPKLSQSNQSIEELKPVSEQKTILKQERESDTNDEIFDDVSENVRWDSDVSDVLSDESPPPAGISAQLPKVTVTQPGRSTYEPSSSGISMRQPRGEKVRELTASLEASLKARQGIKKPAGAVDIHGNKEEEVSDHHEKEKYDDDGDFDDDDFDLSSLDDDDYHELARPKKQEDESRPASSRPLPQHGSSSKLPVEKTSILKFSDDDFDSDTGLDP